MADWIRDAGRGMPRRAGIMPAGACLCDTSRYPAIGMLPFDNPAPFAPMV
ncbi:MAG: hypothetical protein Q4B17_14830 [Lautropia sp.]|nr:hypothetical protein [Lautropia sp.]